MWDIHNKIHEKYYEMLAAFNHCLTWIYSCASSCHAPSPSSSSMGHVCRAYLNKKIRSEVTRGDVRCSSVWRWQVSTQRGEGRYLPLSTLPPMCPTPLLWLQGGHKRLPRSINTQHTEMSEIGELVKTGCVSHMHDITCALSTHLPSALLRPSSPSRPCNKETDQPWGGLVSHVNRY
jgi:hypothetical protein